MKPYTQPNTRNQALSILDIVALITLKNYQRITLVAVFYLALTFSSDPLTKSTGIVGFSILALPVSYVHLRFGSLILALSILFLISLFFGYILFGL